MDPQDLPLRDIHLPEPPAWWPPAPGWWIVALLVLLAAAAIWWRRQRPRFAAVSALDHAARELDELRSGGHAPVEAVRMVSALLRRVAVACFPRTETAALTGENWLRFLDGTLSGKPFSNGPGRMLIDAPYRREVREDLVPPLLDLCGRWIEALESSHKLQAISHKP